MKIGKMKLVITESEDFSEKAILELKKYFEVEVLNLFSEEELLEKIKDADAIFIRLRFKLSKEILSKATSLQYILTATTGLDHIDVDYFEQKGGQVISLKGETDFLGTIPSTAEHTWGLLLALMRNTTKAFDDVKNGFWRRDLFKGNNLIGKKIGILGMGRVGKQVVHYAEAFGMEIGFYDTQSVESKYSCFQNAEDLFTWADVVSIHIPLNKENIRFINKELLNKLNANAILINTSRGAIIDEIYVAELLKQNKIKGYATDVLEDELSICIDKNKLVALSKQDYNVIVTPHIAGATFESMAMTENFIVEKFLDRL
jgi:D-3-phosphoglycerate dehydrogenase